MGLNEQQQRLPLSAAPDDGRSILSRWMSKTGAIAADSEAGSQTLIGQSDATVLKIRVAGIMQFIFV